MLLVWKEVKKTQRLKENHALKKQYTENQKPMVSLTS